MKEDIEILKAKRNPINSCVDLSRNIIGKRNGIFYFTERFRMDFENKMHELGRLKEKNKELEEQFKKVLEYRLALEKDLFENCSNYVISKDKIREKIEELKQDKDCKYYDMFLNERDLEYTINILKELLEE